MVSNNTSYPKKIDEVRSYCNRRVASLSKRMKEESEDGYLSYLIGQEIAHKEVLLLIGNLTSPTTKTGKKENDGEIIDTNPDDEILVLVGKIG